MGPLFGLRSKKGRKSIPSECSSTSSGSSQVSEPLSSAASVDSLCSNRSFRVLNREDSGQSSCLNPAIFEQPYKAKKPTKIYKDLVKDTKKHANNKKDHRSSELQSITPKKHPQSQEFPGRTCSATLNRHIKKSNIEDMPVMHYSTRDVPHTSNVNFNLLERVSSATVRQQKRQQQEQQEEQNLANQAIFHQQSHQDTINSESLSNDNGSPTSSTHYTSSSSRTITPPYKTTSN
jgi:hypothetical protein